MAITRRDACKALAVIPLTPVVPVQAACRAVQPTRVAIAVKAAVEFFGPALIPMLPGLANHLSKPQSATYSRGGEKISEFEFYSYDFPRRVLPSRVFVTHFRSRFYLPGHETAGQITKELFTALHEQPQDWNPDLIREPRPT